MLLPLIAMLIVVAGLGIGFRDVVRFRLRRVTAIAGVCYSESIRRRVLWITPLAMIGVLTVAQLTRPVDAQDAIRQTAKFCLFATGLLVIVASVILACTNLPKEIENRVIYTIVTKPTTRLEIVLGKVMGFAMVSALILAIMGLFSLTYLEIRAASMVHHLRQALDGSTGESIDPARRQTLERYVATGLLSTKALEWPGDLQIYSREPSADGTGWMIGAQGQYLIVGFSVADQERQRIAELVGTEKNPPFLIATLKIEPRNPTADEETELSQGRHPPEVMTLGPTFSASAPTTKTTMPPPLPQVAFRLLDRQHRPIALEEVSLDKWIPAEPSPKWRPGDPRTFVLPLSGLMIEEMLKSGVFYVEVAGVTPTIEYGANTTPIELTVMNRAGGAPLFRRTNQIETPPDEFDTSWDLVERKGDEREIHLQGPRFMTRFGRVGMQIKGSAPPDGPGSVGVYRFDHALLPGLPANGKIGLQLNVSIERSGDIDADQAAASRAAVQVRNRKTGFQSDPVEIEPDVSKLIDIEVPVRAVEGGDFDVAIRGRTHGQYLGLHGLSSSTPSVALIRADDRFAFNLLKSLSILWLLSILVITIAVFCSTFLSWPIAIVLTMLLLLGRWGVEQLGDALAPGGARGVVQDIFRSRDPATNTVVTESLEKLSWGLRHVAAVLPDVGRFPVIDDVDRGVSIPIAKILGATVHLLGYGLPLIVVTYLILRNKEVAP